MTAAIVDHINHFQRRVVQAALADATALYWQPWTRGRWRRRHRAKTRAEQEQAA